MSLTVEQLQGSISLPDIPVDPKGYNWKEAENLLEPYSLDDWGSNAAPSSIPDIIGI
jgi:hypothetical protein